MHLTIAEIIDRNFSRCSNEYKAFALEKDACRKCSIYNHYRQVTQAEGNAVNPHFLFLGEAPGEDESLQVRPFIGKAGQVLREAIKKHNTVFNRNTTMISNIIPCRPLDNKFPETDEPKSCFENWLDREIRLVKPKIIILLGNVPLKYLRGSSGITRQRGTWVDLPGYSARSFATYHPSYVMRCRHSTTLNVVEQFEQDIATVAAEGAKLLAASVVSP